MAQLPLALPADPPPAFANFVSGRNAEVVAALRALAGGAREQRAIYLWGLPGAGKTHLLRALHEGAGPMRARLLGQDSPVADFMLPGAGPPDLLLIDDCDRLDAERQQALFGLLNRVRERPPAASVVAGSGAPRTLALREDLKSRLAWGLVFEVSPLSDDEKAQALARQADERGVGLAADVIPWLLAHTSRDMRSLSALLAALDSHAIARRRRAITLPLVREVLAGPAAAGAAAADLPRTGGPAPGDGGPAPRDGDPIRGDGGPARDDARFGPGRPGG
ncbi:MAG TPA: DnaA regulatory inactivator Hda [Burkholderiaceae bacterium]|nr:DnaA regulatory inactivator Hda [Burkholderiaceae bacterium]